MTESELIKGLKRGHSDSFRSLFVFYYPKFLAFATGLLKDRTAAEDILQEVFLKVWIKRETLDENKSMNNFLFVLTKNAVISYVSRRVKGRMSIETATGIEGRESTEETVAGDEVGIRLLKLIEMMPEKRRKAFIFSRFAGMSNKEIAEKMGISIHTVNRHLTMALSDLKEGLLND